MRCAVELAAVRANPLEDAEQVTQALLGEPLQVEGRHEGWARITTAYGYPGWIREEAIEEGPGELPATSGQTALVVARTFLGAPYEWGGLTDGGIDCSGLVHIAHRLAGRLVPRDAWQQEEAGSPVATGHERAGDLVTYGAGARAGHVAFWLGPSRILHATSRGGLGVVEETEPAELRASRRTLIRL